VIVHPECPMPVVDAADEAGSTDYIRKAVAAANEPTTFAIGTEINMVNRLAAEYPQHEIFCLDPVVCPCSTMYRIHPGYLAWVLEELVAGRRPNVIRVPERVAADARVALDRMLAAKPKAL
jgi:quinolinate synthase